MYFLLEEMIKAAESRNNIKFEKLNTYFDFVMPSASKNRYCQQTIDYDNCRQSCACSFWPMFSGADKTERYIQDAKDRLARIPKPEQ